MDRKPTAVSPLQTEYVWKFIFVCIIIHVLKTKRIITCDGGQFVSALRYSCRPHREYARTPGRSSIQNPHLWYWHQRWSARLDTNTSQKHIISNYRLHSFRECEVLLFQNFNTVILESRDAISIILAGPDLPHSGPRQHQMWGQVLHAILWLIWK